MKLWQTTAGVLACILVAFVAPLALAQDAPQYAPWRDYVLIVESATDDPQDVTYYNTAKPNARYVAVRFSEMSLSIQMDDIEAWYTDFALRDPNGNEYRAESYGVSSIKIVDGKFSMSEQQDAFTLFFDVPSDIPIADLKLYVDTALKTEYVTVSLMKILGSGEEAVEPVETEEASDTEVAADTEVASDTEEAADTDGVEEVEAFGAPAADVLPLGRQLVDMLGESAYATTFDYLGEGNVLKNGSNNSAAKGLQLLLRALGSKISADGKLGSKSISALAAYGAWFAPLNDDGKLTTVDADTFEALLLMLALSEDYAAAALLSHYEDAEQRIALYEAAEQALLGNYYTAQQLYLEMDGALQSDARAALCPQAFPRTGLVYRNEAYPSKRCDLKIKVGGDDGEATYVKIYTLSDDLVLTAFIPANKSATVSLPASTFIIKTGTGTQWYGAAEAFGAGSGTFYSRLYLKSGEDTITLKDGFSYTLSLGVSTNSDGDAVSNRPESWADF